MEDKREKLEDEIWKMFSDGPPWELVSPKYPIYPEKWDPYPSARYVASLDKSGCKRSGSVHHRRANRGEHLYKVRKGNKKKRWDNISCIYCGRMAPDKK